jgi:pilus assembly protein CpaB
MQRRRSILFLVLSGLLGLAAVFAHRSFSVAQAATPIQRTVPVMVARVDLAVGYALEEKALDTFEWPENHLPSGALLSGLEASGRILRRPLVAGEPVLESALLPVGAAGGLSSVIDPERRGVSVKVDQVIGVAGFVKAGAHVDVIATLRRAGGDDVAHSSVILQNIPVLAADQKMQTASDGQPELVNVVTLSVNPDEAQRLVHGAHEGKLQLALRNPGDGALVKLTSVSGREVLGLQKPRAKKTGGGGGSVQVLKGTSVTNSAF